MKKVFVLIIAVLSFSFALHKYYVSILEFSFNAETEQLELSVKVFNDDWQNALDYRLGEPVLLGSKNEYPQIDSLSELYLNDNIRVAINDTIRTFKLLGSEIDGEATWMYLYVDSVSSFNSIKISCSLLTELFDEQRNIIQVKKSSKIKSALLTKSNNTKEFTFD